MGKKNSGRPPVRGVNPVEAMMKRAGDLDRRRGEQIQNQIAAINRLAAALHHEAPWTYTDEMHALHRQLADTQAALRRLAASAGSVYNLSMDGLAEEELHAAVDEAIKALETTPPIGRVEKEENMGKRKDAFMAGFAAGETEDDAQEAWAEYKAEQDGEDADAEGSDDSE